MKALRGLVQERQISFDLLVEVGALQRLHTDSHHAYTVCSPQHHHHLVCTGCDTVEEIVSPSAERLVQDIADHAGFRLQGHLLEILGLCQRCQAAEATRREA